MKEATGELSMTAVVVAVIAVVAIAAPAIVRGVVSSTGAKAKCVAAYGCSTGDANPTKNSQFDCTYDTGEKDANGAAITQPIKCSGADLGYE